MKDISFKQQKGFTLIEMIVVIGIIAILSAMLIAVVDPISQFQKARDTERKTDLAQLQKAFEQYYQDTGSYPASTADFKIIGLNSGTVDWGSANSNNWPYMNVLPADKDTSRTYVYYSTGQTYWLYASLERGSKDPQACNAGSACASLTGSGHPNQYSCSKSGSHSIICNYAVTSPNTSP